MTRNTENSFFIAVYICVQLSDEQRTIQSLMDCAIQQGPRCQSLQSSSGLFTLRNMFLNFQWTCFPTVGQRAGSTCALLNILFLWVTALTAAAAILTTARASTTQTSDNFVEKVCRVFYLGGIYLTLLSTALWCLGSMFKICSTLLASRTLTTRM